MLPRLLSLSRSHHSNKPLVLHILYILVSCYPTVISFRIRRFTASPGASVSDTVKALAFAGNREHSTWWVCHRCAKDDDFERSELMYRAIDLCDLNICTGGALQLLNLPSEPSNLYFLSNMAPRPPVPRSSTQSALLWHCSDAQNLR